MQQRSKVINPRLTRRMLLDRSWQSLIAASFARVLPLARPQVCNAQDNDDALSDPRPSADAQAPSQAVSVIKFQDETGNNASVEGRVLVRASDGVLLEDPVRRLWTIPSARIETETQTERSFEFFNSTQLGNRLIEECRSAGIDTDFHVHTTKNYAISASTPKAYSQWTGQLLERMQIAFQSYWKNRRFELTPLAAPLPVLILSNQAQFAKMAEFDKTPASANGQGYYLVTANRIVLFDLTASRADSSATTIAEIHRRAQRIPASVATVVHEATHQIAFNRGMHQRYADNPVWLTEGMAMYFEAPDLKSRRGWSGIGKVNASRLFRFREFLKARRQPDSIETLVQDNRRFGDAESAIDAYSEAWALTCFLIRTRIRDYSQYLKVISQMRPLHWNDPEDRLVAFQSAFGSDFAKLNRDLLTFTARLK